MLTLDDLVKKDKSELDQLFREGEAPEEDAVEGVTRGAVLAGVGPLRVGVVREAVNTPLLPWKGKVFDDRTGRNRIEVGPVKTQEFEFQTHVSPSIDDGEPTLVLDYDLPENPPGIRSIHDELREIETGLYLGTSNLRVGDDHRFLLYFALESAPGEAGDVGRTVEIEVE
ncbi:MAG: hypothetical protein ACOCT0_05110 [Halobacteriota archaeon]